MLDILLAIAAGSGLGLALSLRRAADALPRSSEEEEWRQQQW